MVNLIFSITFLWRSVAYKQTNLFDFSLLYLLLYYIFLGVDMDGCWLGDYCQFNDVPCPDMTSYGTFDNICPTFTAAICDAETEQNCDMGKKMRK